MQVPIAHPTSFSSRLSHLPIFVSVSVAFPSLLAWKHGYISFICLKRLSVYLWKTVSVCMCVWLGGGELDIQLKKISLKFLLLPLGLGSPLFSWCQQDWNLCKIVRLYFQNVFQIHPFFHFKLPPPLTGITMPVFLLVVFLPFLSYLKSVFEKTTGMFFGNVSWVIPCSKLFLQPYAHFPNTLATLVPQI